MPSLRRRRAEICNALLRRNAARALEDLLWDRIAPVGREFGSPDFDRLMEEDYRNGSGVFDPAVKYIFRSGISAPPVQADCNNAAFRELQPEPTSLIAQSR